jgi:hypothetical protein
VRVIESVNDSKYGEFSMQLSHKSLLILVIIGIASTAYAQTATVSFDIKKGSSKYGEVSVTNPPAFALPGGVFLMDIARGYMNFGATKGFGFEAAIKNTKAPSGALEEVNLDGWWENRFDNPRQLLTKYNIEITNDYARIIFTDLVCHYQFNKNYPTGYKGMADVELKIYSDNRLDEFSVTITSVTSAYIGANQYSLSNLPKGFPPSIIGLIAKGQTKPGTEMSVSCNASLASNALTAAQTEAVGQCVPPQKPVIISPEQTAVYRLSQNNYTETPAIPFAVDRVQNGTLIAWSANLKYSDSGNRWNTNKTDQFTSTHPNNAYRRYIASGGEIEVKASPANDPTNVSDPVKFYVVGSAIPDELITERLVSLYTSLYPEAATPNLMTGICMVESTYQQFRKRQLYGIYELWPNESKDSLIHKDKNPPPKDGSHVGLMSVQTTKSACQKKGVDKCNAWAWNWLENTEEGVRFFVFEKLRNIALSNEQKIIKKHPGLRALTTLERENMALALYGPGAGGEDLEMQYYIAKRITRNGIQIWDWEENKNNLEAKQYVQMIRSRIR